MEDSESYPPFLCWLNKAVMPELANIVETFCRVKKMLNQQSFSKMVCCY
jgi:hypothetical protein